MVCIKYDTKNIQEHLKKALLLYLVCLMQYAISVHNMIDIDIVSMYIILIMIDIMSYHCV